MEKAKYKEILFYPGCNALSVNRHVMKATTAVCSKLNIKLKQLESLSCCGATHFEKTDFEGNLLNNARNIAIIEKELQKNKEKILLTICNTCSIAFAKTMHFLNNKEKRSWVNECLSKINLSYEGNIKVINFIELFKDESVIKLLKEKTAYKPAKLSALLFYGCHILRPKQYIRKNTDGLMEKIITALEGNLSGFDAKEYCCGFHIMLPNFKTAKEMNKEFYLKAGSKCNAIITPCTLCHLSLDIFKQNRNIYVLHIAQLIALCLGVPAKEIGINSNIYNKLF